tara:strand:+ start:412 stop:582 length:171 start_codon:yes stop_codon:yes gene_type:complete
MSKSEADDLRQQLNMLKGQLEDYRIALEGYEAGMIELTEKQRIIYEMFKAFNGASK